MTRAAQALGMTAGETPCAVTFVLPAEPLPLGRIAPRGRAITHCRQLSRREQLQLPHEKMVSHEGPAMSVFDHAKSEFIMAARQAVKSPIRQR